jgi:hypothetical protein
MLALFIFILIFMFIFLLSKFERFDSSFVKKNQLLKSDTNLETSITDLLSKINCCYKNMNFNDKLNIEMKNIFNDILN